jgi:fibronectin-binding autotransporter adhesin
MPNIGKLGWAYVSGSTVAYTGQSDQFVTFYSGSGDSKHVSGSNRFKYDYEGDNLFLTGTLHISGAINSYEFKTIVHESTTYLGTTTFGNDDNDLHQFTGKISGSANATIVGNIYTDANLNVSGNALVAGNITVGDGGEEDQKIILDGAAQDYYLGLDDTDDTFKLGIGSTVGTNAALTIDAAGKTKFPVATGVSGSGPVTFMGAAVLGSTLNVSGSTTLAGNLSGSGNATIVGNVYTDANLLVSGSSTLRGNISGSGNITVDGSVYTNTNLEVSGSTVLGSASPDIVTINSGKIISAANLSGSGYGQFVGNLVTEGTLSVSGSTTLAGNLSGSGHVTVDGSIYTNTNLNVSGSTTLGSADVDVVTITAQLTASQGATFSSHVVPSSDNTFNLGGATARWANVYTGDLHLKNDRGDWTILEEEDYLCVINNKTGKKFKMMLQEIED